MALFGAGLGLIVVGALLVVAAVAYLRRSRRAIGELQAQLVQAQKLESLGLLAGAVAHVQPPRPARVVTRRRRQPRARDELDVPAADRPADRARVWRGPVVVHANSGRLQQVLLNLVVNARDAMPNGGTLTIVTRRTVVDAQTAERHVGAQAGPYALISVEDTGNGIARDVRERMFEPFFTTKPAGVGTGLGLSTVYGIVQQHGGFITVDSAPGEGTRFCVYLPTEPEALATSRGTALRATQPMTSTNAAAP